MRKKRSCHFGHNKYANFKLINLLTLSLNFIINFQLKYYVINDLCDSKHLLTFFFNILLIFNEKGQNHSLHLDIYFNI